MTEILYFYNLKKKLNNQFFISEKLIFTVSVVSNYGPNLGVCRLKWRTICWQGFRDHNGSPNLSVRSGQGKKIKFSEEKKNWFIYEFIFKIVK